MADATNTPANLTPAAAHSLTSRRTGKAKYTATVGHGILGEYIELHGPRGAVYRSLCNIHDKLHRFAERPVDGYVFAMRDGVVSLPREVL